MVTRLMDYKNPDSHYSYDLKQSRFFTKNKANYINVLGPEQLRTIGDVFLLDVFLSAGNVVEPHYHSNASELIYCISGETIVSMINPSTNELKNIRIHPQQVVTIPQGWWHYFAANVDNTHVLTIYDTSELDTVWGSDVLRLTPPEVFAHTYCLDKGQIQQALQSIGETVIIGPPVDCKQKGGYSKEQAYYQPYYPPGPYYTRPMAPPYN
ncbi:cupin domain-containing protein [Lentibacillus cibarius]|nr:cupin domain-containing protein [Lentibacillus cibarius]